MPMWMEGGANWVYPQKGLKVYGFLAGPETTDWHLVKYAWVEQGGVWTPAYNGIGIEPPTNPTVGSSMSLNRARFVANWTNGPNSVTSDYEVVQWYNAFTGLSLDRYFVDSRTVEVDSEPGQEHRVYFTVRSKAVTTGPVGFQRPAGTVVQSAVEVYFDPRDPV